MLHSRTLNNKINTLDEKALEVVYLDFKVYIDELSEKDILLVFIKYSKFGY